MAHHSSRNTRVVDKEHDLNDFQQGDIIWSCDNHVTYCVSIMGVSQRFVGVVNHLICADAAFRQSVFLQKIKMALTSKRVALVSDLSRISLMMEKNRFEHDDLYLR